MPSLPGSAVLVFALFSNIPELINSCALTFFHPMLLHVYTLHIKKGVSQFGYRALPFSSRKREREREELQEKERNIDIDSRGKEIKRTIETDRDR